MCNPSQQNDVQYITLDTVHPIIPTLRFLSIVAANISGRDEPSSPPIISLSSRRKLRLGTTLSHRRRPIIMRTTMTPRLRLPTPASCLLPG
mmetsp:Transcript_23908/g.47780  ORF Transcript_23908/g.47780 Transcript_23908/m.47780 type:complete len:91 (-) Transcript_23908:584-856(-)